MFKCKQCGRAFSANLPDTCPGCGAENRQPDSVNSGKFWAFVFVGSVVELVIFALLIGIVAAIVIKYVLP